MSQQLTMKRHSLRIMEKIVMLFLEKKAGSVTVDLISVSNCSYKCLIIFYIIVQVRYGRTANFALAVIDMQHSLFPTSD